MKSDIPVSPMADTMRHVRQLHFVGIGGAGMCGIAEVLLNLGYRISGTDIEPSYITDRLQSLGAVIHTQHEGQHVEQADAVVVSSAIRSENPEVLRAKELHIPIVARSEMLGELMRHRYGIAIAGSHGKTTTTSLIVDIFKMAELDPTYVIGGLLRSDNRNAKLGSSRYLIAEADESDASFLYLQPMLALITNIDRDHLGTYDQDFNNLKEAFVSFTNKLPFYGALLACIDDEETQSLISQISRPVITYGLSEAADYRARDLETAGSTWRFSVTRPNSLSDLQVKLNLPGTQNVQNALGAIAVASEEGLSDDAIVQGLADFIGVGRRFEILQADINGFRIPMVDDYGHHPTELLYTLDTVRKVWPQQKLLMVYQPHRFTRTRDLFDEFVEVLAKVDDLILLDTYAANETPIEGADGRALAEALTQTRTSKAHFVKSTSEAIQCLTELSTPDHILMVQGAGDVSKVSETLQIH